MTITNAAQLKDLLNLVHDYWFNVEQISIDKREKTVAIYLVKKKSDLNREARAGFNLVIKNAEAMTINDTEQVRDYDLNEIKFDAASRHLTITGGIPITIEIRLAALRIEVINAQKN